MSVIFFLFLILGCTKVGEDDFIRRDRSATLEEKVEALTSGDPVAMRSKMEEAFRMAREACDRSQENSVRIKNLEESMAGGKN